MKNLWGFTEDAEQRCDILDNAKHEGDEERLLELMPFLGDITDEEAENLTISDGLWMILLYLYVGESADWNELKSMLNKRLSDATIDDVAPIMQWGDSIINFTRTD